MGKDKILPLVSVGPPANGHHKLTASTQSYNTQVFNEMRCRKHPDIPHNMLSLVLLSL